MRARLALLALLCASALSAPAPRPPRTSRPRRLPQPTRPPEANKTRITVASSPSCFADLAPRARWTPRVVDDHYVQSPNYPANYSNGVECEQRVSVASGYNVQLIFLAFETELGADELYLYDGDSSADDKLLAR